ncbi:MAG: MgtC/SapB family protein [Alphaproteobacteria bacterium]
MGEIDAFERLALALALGVLIGVERGWHERSEPEGGRVAGVRSFALAGFLGGLWALLGATLGELVLAAAFLAFAGAMVAFRLRAAEITKDYGVTTTIAAFITFGLGALAVRGPMAVAAGGAVVTALLLGIKPVVHRWVERLSYDELLSILKLLVISVVLLPVLPDRGFGPWQALNPYQLWWMVVLVAAISFAGYAAIKLAGERRGIVVAALAGGLVSSTAVAVSLSRLAHGKTDHHRLLAGGIGLASSTMFPRVLVILAVIRPTLLPTLAPAFIAAMLAGYAATAAMLLDRRGETNTGRALLPRNPFELWLAVRFGIFLAVVMLMAEALRTWMGSTGLYLLAAVTGITDVDAIALSVGRMAGGALAPEVALVALLIAVATNTLTKAVIATRLAGLRFGARLVLPLGASLAGGLLALAVL